MSDPKTERAGFTPGREADDDDPQLKSLRAVWLSMPDEDPPERGLAELMAAARVKADQMTKPSLWQRFAALLRRPPMLALATVLVLIGGAVFLGQRRDKVAHEATSEGTPAPQTYDDRARDPGQGAAAGSATAVPGPEMKPEEPKLVAPIAAPEDVPAAEVPPARTHRTPTRRPEGAANATTTSTIKADRETKEEGKKKNEEPQLKVDRLQQRGAGADGLLEKDVAGDRYAPQAESIDSKDTQVTAGVAQTDKSPSTSPPPAASGRAAQYVAQARSAAARGDCSAARLMMKRAAKEDAATYRKALASDESLKKCVGVAAQ